MLVLLKQNIVVRRHGSHLGEPFLDTHKCTMDVFNADANDSFQKRDSASAVGHDEENPVSVLPR